MKPFFYSLLLTLTTAALAAPSPTPAAIPNTCYLFAYFPNNGEYGLHLAWSTNGLKWEALKGGKSFLTPVVGKFQTDARPLHHHRPRRHLSHGLEGQMVMPQGIRHGTAFVVPGAVVRELLKPDNILEGVKQ